MNANSNQDLSIRERFVSVWPKEEHTEDEPEASSREQFSHLDWRAISTRTWLVWWQVDSLHGEGPGPEYFHSAVDAIVWAHNEATNVLNHLDGEQPEGWDQARDKDSRDQWMHAVKLKKSIESAPAGTQAERFLEELHFSGTWGVEGEERDYGDFQSIHEFLSELGDVELWRGAMNEPTIDRVDGIWQMPKRIWENLPNVLLPYEYGEAVDLEDLIEENSDHE